MRLESPALRDSTSLVPAAKLGRVSLILRSLQCAAFIVIFLGFLRLRSDALDMPIVIGFTSDNRAIAGDTKPFEMTDERFIAFARDAVEAALTRNQKGLVPELEQFTSQACNAKLLDQYQRGKPASGDFVQVYTIDTDDGLRLGSANALKAETLIRGIQITRAVGKNTESRFYWKGTFVRDHMTPANPLGWCLNDLVEISEAEFYKADRAKAAAEAVKLVPEDNR